MSSRNIHNIHNRINQAFDDRPQENRSEPSRRQAFINRCAMCLCFVKPATTDSALLSAAQQVAKKSFSINHPCLGLAYDPLAPLRVFPTPSLSITFYMASTRSFVPHLGTLSIYLLQACIVTTGRIILGAARVACCVLLTRALFRVKIRWVSPLRPILLDATVERLTRRGGLTTFTATT